MKIRSISQRWFLNGFALIVAVLLVLEITATMVAQESYYSSVDNSILSMSRALVYSFKDHGDVNKDQFEALARKRAEEFEYKEKAELMIYDRDGKLIITTTGFQPDATIPNQDYLDALGSSSDTAVRSAVLSSGEKVTAVTQFLRDANGRRMGAVRVMTSLEEVDRQLRTVVIGLLIIGIVIIGVLLASSLFFTRSILVPVKKLGSTAKQIAQGDFEVRIKKERDDELGDLCDTINNMAEELGTAERMKNDFISSVSHELRTPLTAIKGWAETLALCGPDEQHTQQKAMKVIIRETERLSGIVEELLDFSRMQSGRMVLMIDKLDMLAELGEVMLLFADRATKEQITLHYDEPGDIVPVLGDRNRLKQVFFNIIDNAVKYSDPGGEIFVSAALTQGQIRVIVKDTGCGISENDLPFIKEKFYKANQTRRGSGIGLAIADEIVRLHNGTIEIESTVGKGTAVTVAIPCMETKNL